MSRRREHGPVVPVLLDADLPAWLVLGYRELHHVTGQSGLFGRDPRRWNLREHVPPDWPSLPYVLYQSSLVCSEGEERRRGGAVGDALDEIDRIELTLLCEKVADQTADAFVVDGRADLIAQYAQRTAVAPHPVDPRPGVAARRLHPGGASPMKP
ncbi:hypothetical protein AB0K05_34380 [Nonomuraea sp. NPDC049486]|uniref:hypothetical protein n=1 Tax=Nonomuraea sp. NPDC049486 TaxID=3155773 RepID=UPI00341DD444